MTERPILFSTPMVKALLEGRKTETRRLDGNRTAARIQPGDTLWVREAWAPADFMLDGELDDPVAIAYRADRQVLYHSSGPGGLRKIDTTCWNWDLFKWKPGIHMPKWAARIRLKVLGVFRDRLGSMSHLCAINEGTSGLAEFFALWDKINDVDGYRCRDNPLVRVIQFELLEPDNGA